MNWSEAVEILKNFPNQRVLVMGGVTLDRHLWGTLTRVSPEASRPHCCQATHRLFAGRGQCGCDRCRARQFIVDIVDSVIDIVIAPGRLGRRFWSTLKALSIDATTASCCGLRIDPRRSPLPVTSGSAGPRSRMLVAV
jgi:hypothetical protein